MGKTTLYTMTDIDLSIYACYHCFYSNAVNIIRNLKSYRSGGLHFSEVLLKECLNWFVPTCFESVQIRAKDMHTLVGSTLIVPGSP